MNLQESLLALIRSDASACDSLFNDLALSIYQHQFSRNTPYQQFCRLQNALPERVSHWTQIPPLPVTAFKMRDIACRPFGEAVHIFHSSGTTRFRISSEHNTASQGQGGEISRHALFDSQIAELAIVHHFKRALCPSERMRLFILTPSPEEAPHSSLSYMMETLRVTYGADESAYYIHRGHLLGEKLAYDLSSVTEPVVLLGASFSFVHFIDFHQDLSFAIKLPPGSRLMDTGGFKGRSRTVSRHWLYGMIESRLGIPQAFCINEYGMSEMTSQFYDGIAGQEAPRVYVGPPQTRWRILDPETLQPVHEGDVGLLAIYDLANIDSVLALLTEDLGRAVGDGFEFVGRAASADIKGCSIALDTLLQETSG